MRPWPDYAIKAIGAICGAVIGREPSREELVQALDLLRPQRSEGTLTQLAVEAGLSRQTLRLRIRKAGLRPLRLGGPTGREEVYRAADVLEALDAQGAGLRVGELRPNGQGVRGPRASAMELR